MAQGQENTDSKDRTLVIKFAKGSDLDERVTDYCGENDCSGADFLRAAIEALLDASGRPAPVETKAA